MAKNDHQPSPPPAQAAEEPATSTTPASSPPEDDGLEVATEAHIQHALAPSNHNQTPALPSVFVITESFLQYATTTRRATQTTKIVAVYNDLEFANTACGTYAFGERMPAMSEGTEYEGKDLCARWCRIEDNGGRCKVPVMWRGGELLIQVREEMKVVE